MKWFDNIICRITRLLCPWQGILLCLVLCFLARPISAQLYPVTASLEINPPYSPLFYTFSDVSPAPYRANKIQLLLTLNDLNEPSLPVRLEWEISGPDASFSSSSEFLELPIRDECKRKILRDNAIEVFKLDIEP